MNDLYFKIPRMSDRAVLERFAKLKHEFRLPHSSANAAIGISFSPIPDDIEEGEPTGVLSAILEENGFILHTASLGVDNMSITYTRGGRDQSPFLDEIRVYYNGNGTPNVEMRMAILAAVKREFETFEKNGLSNIRFAEGEELAALHQTKLDRLEELNADLIRSTTATYNRLEEEFDKRKRSADEELVSAKKKLIAEHELILERLRVDESELEKKKKELDDRGNTHARRELRNRMLQDVKARIATFGVSRTTEKKRSPVRLAMVTLATVLLALTIWTSFELNAQQNIYRTATDTVAAAAGVREQITRAGVRAESVNSLLSSSQVLLYLLWGRLSLFSIGFVGALLYYIRWETRWADQHTNAEFQLQQFYVDVNRANWAIETGLEWKKETQSEIPNTILDSITRNLFRAHDEVPPALHPADELASALLGSASKLKIKNGENELEFNNPKKIPNDAKSKTNTAD
jgi:hypothetical protein